MFSDEDSIDTCFVFDTFGVPFVLCQSAAVSGWHVNLLGDSVLLQGVFARCLNVTLDQLTAADVSLRHRS